MSLVTISMPVGPGTPFELVKRAVDAVCAQTLKDWRLVVIGDGVAIPGGFTDSRIVRYTLPENRGRYFADAVVFAGTSSPYFTVHDADDAARPEWLRELYGLINRGSMDYSAAYGAQVVHRIGGAQVSDPVVRWRGVGDPPRLRHYCHMAQLFRRSWLEEIGGPHPAFRVGFDTLLTSLPFVSGHVGITDVALYDRFKRGGSLTTALETGMRSRLRRESAAMLAMLWRSVCASIREGVPETPALHHHYARHLIRQVLTAYPNVEAYEAMSRDVADHGKRLRELIGEHS